MAAKVRFNKAAVDGLLLAAITIILSLVTSVTGGKFISILVWIVKLVATMWALYYFMKKNTQLNTAEGIATKYNDAFKYGFTVSIFSVILIAVYAYVSLFFIDTEAAMAQAQQQMEVYAAKGANMESLNWIMNNYELVTLVGTLVLYTIWSAIASAIFASSAKSPANPFTAPAEGDNQNS